MSSKLPTRAPTPVLARVLTACQACDAPGLVTLFSLGNIPPINAFPDRSELAHEQSYPLDLAYCPACNLVQLRHIVPPDELFSHYLHLSSASTSNEQHLHDVADVIRSHHTITPATRILDIGSNDGTLLSYFQADTAHLLGVDPAKNLLPLSQARGITTIPQFLTPAVAATLAVSPGPFDIVLALNVVAHTPGLIDLLTSIHTTLAPGGTFMIEAAYVLDTVLQGEFDTIYHEHVYCFSLHALQAALARAGLTVTDAQKIPTQGGSIRVFAKRQADNPTIESSVAELLREEKDRGLTSLATYTAVSERVTEFIRRMRKLIDDTKVTHGPLVGLGAPARGVVILNTCQIGTDDLAYVVDDTPLKQGRYVPGVHVPITSWQALAAKPARAFMLLSWNYEKEIMAKLRHYITQGLVIVPFPSLHTIRIEDK